MSLSAIFKHVNHVTVGSHNRRSQFTNHVLKTAGIYTAVNLAVINLEVQLISEIAEEKDTQVGEASDEELEEDVFRKRKAELISGGGD